MEEKEVIKESETTESKKVNKIPYEQLETLAHQMQEQLRTLYKQLQESNLNNTFTRLEFLFKVIENKDAFGKDFIKNCVEEIQELMTIKEAPDKEE